MKYFLSHSVQTPGMPDGGLRLEINLEIPYIELDGGAISGYGSLVVLNQMIWTGGTLTNSGPNGPTNVTGTLTINASAGLYMIPATVRGQAQVLTLNRPINILGSVGWLGGVGSISVPTAGNNGSIATNDPQSPGTLFINTQAEVIWNYSAVTNPNHELAIPTSPQNLRNLAWVTNSVSTNLGSAAGVAQFLNASLQTRDGREEAIRYFTTTTTRILAISPLAPVGVPAIFRASIEVAWERTHANAPDARSAQRSLMTYLQSRNLSTLINAFRTSNRQDLANPSTQFATASTYSYLRMGQGILAGIWLATGQPIVDLVHYAYQVVTNPIQTAQSVINRVVSISTWLVNFNTTLRNNPAQAVRNILDGLSGLWTWIQEHANWRSVLTALFPDWVDVYTLYQNSSDSRSFSPQNGELKTAKL